MRCDVLCAEAEAYSILAKTTGTKSLKGKTLFISGASRGIGLAIGLRAARDGANVIIGAKTATPHARYDSLCSLPFIHC